MSDRCLKKNDFAAPCQTYVLTIRVLHDSIDSNMHIYSLLHFYLSIYEKEEQWFSSDECQLLMLAQIESKLLLRTPVGNFEWQG